MDDTFISSQIRRSNRNLLVVNAILLTLLLLVSTFTYNYFYNLLAGPFKMTPGAVEKLKGPQGLNKYHIAVSGVDIADTGLQYVSSTYEDGTNKLLSSTVEAEYYFLLLANKALVIKSDPNTFDSLSFSGLVKDTSWELRRELLSQWELFEAEVSYDQFVLPFILDTQVKTGPAYIWLSVWLIAFLFCLWNLSKFFARIFDRYRHPIIKNLKLYGEPDAVAAAIEQQIQAEGLRQIGSLFLTKEWFFHKRFFGLKTYPAIQVLWVYKRVTRQRVNYIPVGNTYSLAIHLRDKKIITVGMGKGNVDKALAAIAELAPEIVNGYSEELAGLWQRDYAGFIDAVRPA